MLGCASVAVVSPFFKSVPLAAHGLEWVTPPVMLAHPLDDGPAAWLYRSVERTAEDLGRDGSAYRRLFTPLVDSWPKIAQSLLGPVRWPRHPLVLARFGIRALQPANALARRVFGGERARALIGGTVAHSMIPLEDRQTGGVALALALTAHVAGWCIPRGGAQRLTNALAAHLRSLGGEIVAGRNIRSLEELPPRQAILCDLSPQPLLRIAGQRFPPRFRRALQRYHYGMGVFKVDWALDGPVPWSDEACTRAGTIHLGGTLDEISKAERQAREGGHPDRPFVLLSQPTLFDPSRAPANRHIAWAYCHVPHGSGVDMLPRSNDNSSALLPGFATASSPDR